MRFKTLHSIITDFRGKRTNPSGNFAKGKKYEEIRAYFEEALRFIERYQPKETIISAVVHMDEKTPHMHLSFVPLTKDGRLSAKEIVGNKKKLTWWHNVIKLTLKRNR